MQRATGISRAAAAFALSVGVEFTPIKDWLEIEVGTGPLFAGAPAQWGTDLLFKKPFDLSKTTELMVGLGPEWTSTFGGGSKFGVEFAADFMFWPWPDRKYGRGPGTDLQLRRTSATNPLPSASGFSSRSAENSNWGATSF